MTSEKAPNDDLTGVPPEGGAPKAASVGHEAPDDAMIAQAEAAILAASARRLPLRGLIEQALLRLRRPLRTKKPNTSATRGPVTEKHKSQGLAQFDTAEVNAARLNVAPSRAAPDGPAVAAAPTLSASERKSPRKLKRRAGIWTVLLFVAAALFLGLVSMSATGRVVAMPDWVARSVEERLNAPIRCSRFVAVTDRAWGVGKRPSPVALGRSGRT